MGEYLVHEYFDNHHELPNLSVVPVGTKNINAISQDGERYSIKSTTGNVTEAFYGLEPQGSTQTDMPIFEYVIICKLDDACGLEGIYQLSWKGFIKHKKWHSRMNAWNVALTKAMREDAIIIYEKNKYTREEEKAVDDVDADDNIETDDGDKPVITWDKTKVNHNEVKDQAKERLQKILKCNFDKTSSLRYVSPDKETALYVLSASYSKKMVNIGTQ